VISLHQVDSPLLVGVPITAITEALAFVFQSRDLELLGKAAASAAEAQREQMLNHFWMTWEHAGVALVEIRAWRWMYEHPDAQPAELRDAVVGIAREIWNRHFAPVLGGKDSAQLAIYSHMLSTPLYLYNYAIGRVIAVQLEEHFAAKGRARLGAEFARMARHGKVTPDLWMENATGAPVGTAALFRATERALAGAR
jgi:oligoendopeptidase F